MQSDSYAEDLLTDESRYRLLIEAVTDYAIYMLDPRGHVSSWNPGAERFTGYSQAEILGSHFSIFYTEDDRAAGIPDQALSNAARQGRHVSEGWRVRKDGSRFWADVVIDPIRAPSGAILGYAKITRDHTERNAVEIALRQSEEQFRLLVEGVSDYAIFMLDIHGCVATWNTGAERIKGYSRKEILGEHLSRFYTDEDRAAGIPQRALESAARTGKFESEGWRVRKDGTRFWANVLIDAIRGENGNVVAFAKITRDDTERRKAQQDLDLAREALHQSQKLEAIGQLTGGVAHDFNNLLAAIISSLELVRKRTSDAKSENLLHNALKAAQRGTALIQRMLAFARRQELDIKPVHIPSLVLGMLDLVQRTIGSAITVETSVPNALPLVMADENQLEMALLNLVVNARDAMMGRGTIRIIARRCDVIQPDGQPASSIFLSVIDDGGGMDAATLARATEPFFTTKEVGNGTGLGLSMVQGLVEQFGGRFSLTSQLGVGTEAEIALPVVEVKRAAAALPSSDQEQDSTDRKFKVLAVDDDGLVLMGVVAMIEDLGHEVLTASTGAQALDILRRNDSINLLLTDQSMPGMTGLELAVAAREHRPDLAVILATGYGDVLRDSQSAFPRLSKPYMQSDLAQMLSEI